MLYIRSFDELKGITSALEKMISTSLAQSFAEGRGPYQIARILARRATEKGMDLSIEDSMGRAISAERRAVILARTEVIRAHSEANLNVFEEAKVEGVGVKAEWSTAGDDRVCPLCQPLEGQIFTIAEARGKIPLHPQCRCTWVPMVA